MSEGFEPEFARAIDLLYGGLPQLGPGSDEETTRALRALPRRARRQVVDVGCGTGRQTLVLARELDAVVDAVDLHPPFLRELERRAAAVGLAARVRTYALDMARLAERFAGVDLLWSEGAAYQLGWRGALTAWRPVLAEAGHAAISECTWLVDEPPEIARRYWESGYPTMGTVDANVAAAEECGYAVLDTFALRRASWVEGYYDHLAPRAAALAGHDDPVVRQLVAETREELAMFAAAGDSYGYVFYLLERRAD